MKPEFAISITAEADRHLRAFSAREQRIIESAVVARLRYQPTQESNAIRRLRPNPLTEFELRIGDFRVLYNVEAESHEVVLLVVGRKVGNSLIVGGVEFHGHRDDPAEPAADGPAEPVE
jgi:mRNA-degrading endonuclease RelE of RelBE toxin-antitoxin system